jgi:hypothetical protein
MFRNRFSPAAHPNLPKTHDGTPQNVASRRGDMKQNIGINVCLHINPCPIRMQAYENKTLLTLDKTIDDDPVCVCVCYEL